METKVCNGCRTRKPVNDFHKSKATLDGLTAQCKVCNNKRSKQWKEKNPKYHRSEKNHGEKIPPPQYGECDICHELKLLVRDHDHSCHPRRPCQKCYRGDLCNSCNIGLGWFKDSPQLLIAAADYLARRGAI